MKVSISVVMLLTYRATSVPGLAQTQSPDTQRIRQANRARVTAADRAAAHQLILKGDGAYRAGNYAAAFQAYRDAYPDAPSA